MYRHRVTRYLRSLITVSLPFIFYSGVYATPNEIPPPVIFVHGIGDSSVIWREAGPKMSKYYSSYYVTADHPYFIAGSGIGKSGTDRDFTDNIRNSCIYVTFTDRFASPREQVEELRKVILDTQIEVADHFPHAYPKPEDVRVDIVAFSMGSLTARSYITKYGNDHHVRKLIMASAPHRGVDALSLNWVPKAVFLGGITLGVVTLNPVIAGVGVLGLGVDGMLYAYGVATTSPAGWALRPDSPFLKELNSTPHPEDIEYISILGNVRALLPALGNRIFFREGGDGGVSIESQELSLAGIPNFSKLSYREFMVDAEHMKVPYSLEEVLKHALQLNSASKLDSH